MMVCRAQHTSLALGLPWPQGYDTQTLRRHGEWLISRLGDLQCLPSYLYICVEIKYDVLWRKLFLNLVCPGLSTHCKHLDSELGLRLDYTFSVSKRVLQRYKESPVKCN